MLGFGAGFLAGVLYMQRQRERELARANAWVNDPKVLELVEASKRDPRFRLVQAEMEALDDR